MKKAAISLCILALLLGTTFHVAGAPPSHAAYSFHFSAPSVETRDGYVALSVDNATTMLQHAGEPVMPSATKTVTFPRGTRITDVDVHVHGMHTRPIDTKVVPGPEPIPLNMQTATPVQEPGPVYDSSEMYPEEWLRWHTGAGLHEGEHVMFLTLQMFPVRYAPQADVLRYVERIDVEVSYEEPSSSPVAADGGLLIIAPETFSDELQPLVDHKNGWGIDTELATLSETAAVRGRDDAEKIKYYIKRMVERNGVSSVLLVGSADRLPTRMSYTDDGHDTPFITDLYYADIYAADGSFSSWDSNDNDRFAEIDYRGNSDTLDLYPDVELGRLPCDSEGDVETVVDKIIQYETTASGAEWMDRAVLCAGDSHDDDDGVLEGEYTKNHADRYLGDFDITRLYASTGDLSTQKIRQEISTGAGFVDFSGHGNRYSWATHPPGDFDTWTGFKISDISLLSNDGAYPVVVLDACSCGDFSDGTCIAWQFVRASDKGAIATYAATALSWGYLGSYCVQGLSGYMDVHLTEHIAARGTTGAALSNAQTDYLNDHGDLDAIGYKVVQEFALFGDPTLAIGGRGGCSIGAPRQGHLYLYGNEVMSTWFGRTIVVGPVEVSATTSEDITTVEFHVDGELQHTATEQPYTWRWDQRSLGSRTLTIVGHRQGGGTSEHSIQVLYFNL